MCCYYCFIMKLSFFGSYRVMFGISIISNRFIFMVVMNIMVYFRVCFRWILVIWVVIIRFIVIGGVNWLMVMFMVSRMLNYMGFYLKWVISGSIMGIRMR